MKDIRTFIAIPMEPKVQSEARSLVRALEAEGDGVRWVPLDDLHLTLKFLGEVDNTRIHGVCQVVRNCCLETPATELHLTGVGGFPNAERPRIVWAGIADGGPILAALVEKLEIEFAKLGFKREPRDWQPHLTLGRTRRGGRKPAQLQQRIADNADRELGHMIANKVCVYASFLDKHGPTYQVMDTIHLE
ncbi:2',5' RNA ligase family [Roseimaritima multifibrata]|uniref:RNA 2',3'-cyclic phosphodiesterase n=1 Tax=Roseimaritima multifibrata TaxID=1930274 RepID=A0A517M9T6_9BACT|nr:RNA 2',3'-cyclic phosphodiesterase [Roseimaritima multifibrata]QDS91653.1 2',5' RNA ligase family [Roseimaritima multifibrata]